MNELAVVWPVRLQDTARRWEQAGHSLVCLAQEGRVVALFALAEQIRAEMPAVLRRLTEMGLELGVLTGDSRARGDALAATLRLPVQAELLPDQKLAAVRAVRRRVGPTAVIGDGVNDAPALAGADVGIAVSSAADLACQSADVCLLANDLARLPWAIALARRTCRTIRQNLLWAFAYNVIGVGLACVGLLNPIWASVAMVASSLAVIANSLRRLPLPAWDDRAGDFPPFSGRPELVLSVNGPASVSCRRW